MGDAVLNAFSVKTPVGIMCKNCRDDDSMGGSFESLLTAAFTEECAGLCNKDAAAELEVNFCNKIKSAQGSKYLKSTKSCSIKFDNTDNNAKQVANAASSNNVATIDSTLILKGVAGDATSKDELAIIANAFVSAYNDVHWDANHYLADVEIPFAAGTPDPDSIMCKNCRDDDSMGTQFDIASLKSNDFNKKMVEVAFCKKLQNSVSTKLSVTKSCSIAVESVIADTASTKAY
jgi:hypothetical protein